MPRKVIVKLKGGLGNQLFCYAAARRLAWSNNAELVLDTVSGFKFDRLYQRTYALSCFQIPARHATSIERMEPFGRVRRLITRKLSEKKPLRQRRYIRQVGVDFDPGILSLRLQESDTYFDPFGQSERYFSDIREIIAQELQMSVPSDQENRDIGMQIDECQSVALHVRWFDVKNDSHSSNMSAEYYSRAISHMLAKIERAHFFVFSDRPDLTATLLSPIMQGRGYTVVRHNIACGNAEADFWLMRRCRHFIIGNSTFAWWAAWLGEHSHDDAQVIAPACNVDSEHNVTAWGFPYLLPERWFLL